MERTPKVAIVLAHWQNYEVTRDCLASMETLSYPNYEVVVVDDGSPNRSGKKLKEAFPKYHFILSPENQGLAKATNQGFRYALEHGAEFILWINNDTVFTKPDLLSHLVSFLEKYPKAGAVGPMVLSPDGSHQKSYKRSFESLVIDMWGVGTLEKWSERIFSPHANECPRKAPWIVGVAVLLRKEALTEAGLMDEDFPFGGEDVDLLFRMGKKGWETYYYPFTEIIHLGSMSHKETSSKYHNFYVQSPLRFFEKNYSPREAAMWRQLLIGAFLWRGVLFSGLGVVKKSYRQKARSAFEGARIARSFTNTSNHA